MRLARFGPQGLYCAQETPDEPFRVLYSDPFDTLPGGWEFGSELRGPSIPFLAPVSPGKIVGVGRNYKEHVKELSNPMPSEPVLFLKAPSSIIGPLAPVVLPPESQRVEFEGEVAVVLRLPLRRATIEQARAAILGFTAACDVTARDLQKKDPCFSRAKSFDSFCPIGPVIAITASESDDVENLEVTTRINGEQRQHAHVREMSWGILEQLVYVSRMMSLEPGDVILTGTPAGVGPLADGDQIEVEVSGVGVLRNPVEAFRG
jgi:2-keto-4-pentenoate hydratase/2-oxohepta-3-ene-1,7-dioic acid hydratase in catechol pathway